MKPSKAFKKYYLNRYNGENCSKKIKIKDKREAIRRAYYEQNKHRTPTHCYFCPCCGNYHLTTKESIMDRLERVYELKLD